MSKVIKSEEKLIPVISKDINFDLACSSAYKQALIAWGFDENGNSKLSKTFPRSDSSINVEFVSFKISTGMNGREFLYLFKTWIEKDDE